MLNHVAVMGRLTRDPELRRTQTGTPVATFTLAVERDFKPNKSDRQTDFLDVVAWKNTAEFVHTYFRKGKMAVVSGRLQTTKWVDNNGNNRVTWEIAAENVYFGESRAEESDK